MLVHCDLPIHDAATKKLKKNIFLVHGTAINRVGSVTSADV